MSAAIEDLAGTFERLVRNVGTTAGLVAGVAVFTFMLPVILQLVGVIKSLTGQGGVATTTASTAYTLTRTR